MSFASDESAGSAMSAMDGQVRIKLCRECCHAFLTVPFLFFGAFNLFIASFSAAEWP